MKKKNIFLTVKTIYKFHFHQPNMLHQQKLLYVNLIAIFGMSKNVFGKSQICSVTEIFNLPKMAANFS